MRMTPASQRLRRYLVICALAVIVGVLARLPRRSKLLGTRQRPRIPKLPQILLQRRGLKTSTNTRACFPNWRNSEPSCTRM